MNLTAWTPKSFLALRDYNGKKFAADLAAGVTVSMVALPLSMAFAIASGAPPEAGLYTAVVAGLAISALGGSRNQIGGPTGAFVVIIAGTFSHYGFNGLLVCTILPGDFVRRMRVVIENAHSVSPATTLLSCASLLLIVLTIRLVPRVPGYIVALLAATVTAYFLHLPVETIGTRFGGIPSGFPRFHLPVFEYAMVRTLISPAITVALLGAIESLMSAVVADRMSGDQHNPNMELTAQGIANILSPLCGGLPATGAMARTATSIRCGAVTPVAGMIHALTVLAVLLFAAPLARFIPLAGLSAILMAVCSNMGEWREVPQILRHSKLEIGVWLTTLLLTVFAGLTVAVEGGMILASLVFIRKVTLTTTLLLCGAREQPSRLMGQAAFA